MNIHTFKDATTDRRSALANEIIDDDDDDEDDRITERARRRGDSIEGEEEESTDKFNEMGEVIEPFNLKNEREGGGFDENNNYVFHKERGEIDAWLADMDEAQMERGIGEAAKAQKLKQDQSSAQEQEESKRQQVSSSSLKAVLISLLAPGENVWQAMRRLGSKPGARKRAEPAGGSVDDGINKAAQINQLTEAADLLLGRGETNIYDTTQEGIILSDIKWEYQGKDGQVYGAFTSDQISGWIENGFFTGDSAVLIRRATAKFNSTGAGDVRKTTKRRVSWRAETGNSSDEGGYEECKGEGGGGKRERPQNDNNGMSPSKRSRVEAAPSDDLLNDLEDSDDEEEESVTVTLKDEVDSTIARGGVSAGAGAADIYDDWQSSDDIDWSLILKAQGE